MMPRGLLGFRCRYGSRARSRPPRTGPAPSEALLRRPARPQHAVASTISLPGTAATSNRAGASSKDARRAPDPPGRSRAHGPSPCGSRTNTSAAMSGSKQTLGHESDQLAPCCRRDGLDEPRPHRVLEQIACGADHIETPRADQGPLDRRVDVLQEADDVVALNDRPRRRRSPPPCADAVHGSGRAAYPGR
jgi:hypothetical protein